jgi:hypothetical protein
VVSEETVVGQVVLEHLDAIVVLTAGAIEIAVETRGRGPIQ